MSDTPDTPDTTAATDDAMQGERYHVTAATYAGDWPILLLLALDVAFGLWAITRMPHEVVIHWGPTGEPDGWGPAWVNALMPVGLGLLLYFGLLYVPLLDRKERNWAAFTGAWRVVRAATVLFTIVVHVALCTYSMGYAVDVPFVIRLGVPALFLMLGLVMPRFKRNGMAGFRAPWTLNDEEVWDRTHRFAGNLWVVGSLLLMGAAFLPMTVGMIAFFVILLPMAIAPFVYAYRLHKDKQQKEATG